MQKPGQKIKRKSKVTNDISKDTRGFYFAIGCCLIIFAILLFALPHLLKNLENPNTIREQQAALGLHVNGNKLLNGKGQEVILHGVDRSGTEYQCIKGTNKIFDGPSDQASIQAMKSWKINVVRIPLNEDCWLGINEASPSGQIYQQAISNYVKLLDQNHLYVILDLHWNAPGTTKATGQQVMADADHSFTFWTSVGNTFKGNQNIIFDLYNEPHDISWSCWQVGMNCNTPFTVANIQDLVNTVRGTGANNVLMIGGLEYANDLSGWIANRPTDGINNIVASWHMYGKNRCATKECWDKTIAPVMAQVPVIAGEFGESTDGGVCDKNTNLSNSFMNWMDQHHSGYLAWTWDTWGTDCGNLSLITDYKGTPKSPNGTNYQNHLEQF